MTDENEEKKGMKPDGTYNFDEIQENDYSVGWEGRSVREKRRVDKLEKDLDDFKREIKEKVHVKKEPEPVEESAYDRYAREREKEKIKEQIAKRVRQLEINEKIAAVKGLSVDEIKNNGNRKKSEPSPEDIKNLDSETFELNFFKDYKDYETDKSNREKYEKENRVKMEGARDYHQKNSGTSFIPKITAFEEGVKRAFGFAPTIGFNTETGDPEINSKKSEEIYKDKHRVLGKTRDIGSRLNDFLGNSSMKSDVSKYRDYSKRGAKIEDIEKLQALEEQYKQYKDAGVDEYSGDSKLGKSQSQKEMIRLKVSINALKGKIKKDMNDYEIVSLKQKKEIEKLTIDPKTGKLRKEKSFLNKNTPPNMQYQNIGSQARGVRLAGNTYVNATPVLQRKTGNVTTDVRSRNIDLLPSRNIGIGVQDTVNYFKAKHAKEDALMQQQAFIENAQNQRRDTNVQNAFSTRGTESQVAAAYGGKSRKATFSDVIPVSHIQLPDVEVRQFNMQFEKKPVGTPSPTRSVQGKNKQQTKSPPKIIPIKKVRPLVDTQRIAAGMKSIASTHSRVGKPAQPKAVRQPQPVRKPVQQKKKFNFGTSMDFAHIGSNIKKITSATNRRKKGGKK